MTITIIIAHIFGIAFMVMGISMASNKKWTSEAIDRMFENQGLTWAMGFITVMLGAVMVVLHNVWSSGLTLLITIIGWLTLVKGATILIFPNFSNSYYKKMNKGNIFVWGGVVICILGVLLFFTS